jgi:glycerophosphoryl diester phosphodiesterase
MVMLPSPAPRHGGFLIAHRAGNDLTMLRDAVGLGARLVECDLRLFRGRIEVRHLKTVGPIPILWDTWHLANPFRRRLQLHELLDADGPMGAELMLDLKGRDPRLSRRVIAELDARSVQLPVTVCARSWKLLDAFEDRPDTRTVCSVGSKRGLRRLLAHRRERRLGGVSIHANLLDAQTVGQLREKCEVVMTWPVNCAERARTLLDWGVHGLITDEAHVIEPVVRARHDHEAAA